VINSHYGISAYMLLDEYMSVGWIQGINRNEIFHTLIKWGNPKFDQNPKYRVIWNVNFVADILPLLCFDNVCWRKVWPAREIQITMGSSNQLFLGQNFPELTSLSFQYFHVTVVVQSLCPNPQLHPSKKFFSHN